MEQKNEINSYNNNYSILSTNLTNNSNKYKQIYRMSSPVLIQSYGKNNFVVELKYKTKKKDNDKINDEYDFIEKELKKVKKNNKAYTTYTEISSEESLFFVAQIQKPNLRFNKDFKNYINYSPNKVDNSNNDNNDNNDNDNNDYSENIYKNDFYQDKNNKKKNNYNNDTNKNNDNKSKHNKDNKDNYIYDQNYNCPKNELCELDKRIYVPKKKNSNRMNKSINDLKSQRFCTSFISSNNKSTQSSSKKSKLQKHERIKNIPIKNISRDEKKERGVSKSKNQLQDFNIDKLKEIGDNFALRYMTKRNQLKNKFQNKQNSNTISSNTILSEKKDKHNGILNKIIMIEKKRKESKSKLNLINKTEIKKYPGEEENNTKNDKVENKRIFEMKKINDNNNDNINNINNINNNNKLSNRTKILKINKNEVKLLNLPFPYTKKIKLNNLIKRKKYNLRPDNNTHINTNYNNYNEESNSNYYTIKKKDSSHLENKNSFKIEQNNNQYNNQYSNNSNNNSNNKNEKINKIYKKVQNVNSRIMSGTRNIKNKNINHNFYESINIKINNNITKTENSYNNVFYSLK